MDSIYDYEHDPTSLIDEEFKRRTLEACDAADQAVDSFVGALRRIDPEDPDPPPGIVVTPEMLDGLADIALWTARMRAMMVAQRTVEERIAELDFEPEEPMD